MGNNFRGEAGARAGSTVPILLWISHTLAYSDSLVSLLL